ncbi:MAG TPA: patatin-like phospholipase family protein [Thermodesulfovibrionales bacterium]|nr:patatin-like phospholipase family protein [Thermodesulfovibrionales bacterium]
MVRKIVYCFRFFFFLILVVTLASCEPKNVRTPPQPAKVALVLGAGTSKGFAHIGVLKVLESNGIPIHMIVGTSVGSFVGSFYAYGYNAFQLQKISFGIEKSDLIDYTVPDNGFVRGEKLEEYVNRYLRNTPMEKLKTPFYAVATDIQSGREMVFASGNTGTAVRASCSVPGVFRPVKIGERSYVDGGVVSPVAVDAAKRLGADIVIAVDLSAVVEGKAPESTVDTILQSLNIMYAKLASLQISRADVVIRPKVESIAPDDFSKRHEAILEGEKAATEALPRIRSMIDTLRREGRL